MCVHRISLGGEGNALYPVLSSCNFVGACVCVCAVLVLVVIAYIRWLTRPQAYASGVDAHDDVRENIIHYDEEGVGGCSCCLSVLLIFIFHHPLPSSSHRLSCGDCTENKADYICF